MGGRGNSPPYAKNEGGGGGGGEGIVLSVQKDGRGNVHPLLYCRRENALTLPKIGGESSYLPDLSRGGKCPGGEMSEIRCLSEMFCLPSEKGSTLKRKNLSLWDQILSF